jgi:hypothetical protein
VFAVSARQNKRKMRCDICCFVFSIIGAVFLVFVGVLCRVQPEFMMNITDPAQSGSGCFVAAAIYIGFMVISASFIFKKNRNKEPSRAWQNDQLNSEENREMQEPFLNQQQMSMIS